MNRRDFIKMGIGAGLGGLALTSVRAGAGHETRRPNILWITMDDARADTLGCYGRPWVRTPHMDALAARGVRFETAIVQNPVCVPSRLSMKSGHYPHTFGITAMGKPASVTPEYMKRAREVPNLLNAWKDIGMAPVNLGKTHAHQRDWAYQQDVSEDFDVLGRPRDAKLSARLEEAQCKYPAVVTKTHGWAIGGTVPMEPQETATWKIGDLAVQKLAELTTTGRPFFLRVSFHAPHVPCWVPPSYFIDPGKIDLPVPNEDELAGKPRFEREQLRIYAGGLDLTTEQIGIARSTYYGMVSLVDEQVGRLVDCLRKARVLDNTIVAINSDQGWQLGEHGLWKKRVLYDDNVKAPLVLSCPSLLPSGKVIGEPVEMIDFVPTLLDLSGLDVLGSIRGRSLMPLIRGHVTRWREACFCEIDHSMSMYDELREHSGRRVMVRTKEWKLIWFMDERVADKDGALYNLREDPGETVNLYGRPDHADVVEHLERLCREWDRTA
ncbi:MAG TPA: sulfatase-like hydrolase/transferase [Sedimentisphaerales bacterium]|jgi:arylsulfatase A-like enzyme|nr:sulfatase-like hydrolase/transferase [Sedimentisphaerales bacterium]HNU28030.1 sulfatase-like hydrolase/transferase [Sedimentisphaerales bacterium]